MFVAVPSHGFDGDGCCSVNGIDRAGITRLGPVRPVEWVTGINNSASEK
jgi:hypothetical protein